MKITLVIRELVNGELSWRSLFKKPWVWYFKKRKLRMGKRKEYRLSRTGEEVKRNVWNFLLRTSGSFNLNSEHLDGE